MVDEPGSAHLAVLIDADNVSYARVPALLGEVATLGRATVRRMYADWTEDKNRGWKDAANEHSIQPIQQFAYTTGKNATDSAMIIDAMDLLYTGRFDGFCLVSSDSDFTKLASRLRESGVTVYGFGERKTPQAFVKACDRFFHMDVLSAPTDDPGTPDGEQRPTAGTLRQDTKLLNLLRSAIQAGSDADGWAHLAQVGAFIAKQEPDFDSRNWKYAKLVDLVTAIGLFEIERRDGAVRVRTIKR
ncbi:NYN domain-containing protein [Nocardioides sp. T5]|uniref:NYN domain-containing protein n=1 Tax=Nocardioides sp. T5 TaxID=3400182 RepID=UPI003A89F50E